MASHGRVTAGNDCPRQAKISQRRNIPRNKKVKAIPPIVRLQQQRNHSCRERKNEPMTGSQVNDPVCVDWRMHFTVSIHGLCYQHPKSELT
jgi:hypothetical protein